MMWQATLRDLQWRRRRFMIAITGTALVFAMTLLLSGLSASFTLETDRTLKAIGGDVWVVKEGASGPFTAFSPVPETDAARVAAVDGVTEAQPIIYLHQTVGDEPKDINLFGVVPGALGEPSVSKGRGLQGAGEALADSTLGADVGETVQMAGRDYEVVGVTKHTTLNGGIATMFITLDDAQTLLGGNAIASAIVATGAPTAPIDGLRVMTLDEARTDLLRPLKNASQSIDFVKILLWIVAACIIGSIIYLSAMERDPRLRRVQGDRYLERRTRRWPRVAGRDPRSVAAAVLASVIAILLAPVFPLPVEIPTSAFVILFGIAIVGRAARQPGRSPREP